MRESTVRRCGGVALTGTLVFVAVAVVVQWLRPDLDWLDAPLSFYLLGGYGHVLQAAYVVLACALVFLGGGFYGALRREARSLAPWSLFTYAASALVVTALAHSNLPGHAPTLQGLVHGVAAQAAFLGATVAMLLQSWRLRDDARWRSRFRFAFALALVCFVGLWVDAIWKGMPRGLEQKLLIALIVCWLLCLKKCAVSWMSLPSLYGWWMRIQASWCARKPPGRKVMSCVGGVYLWMMGW